ncbi:MAG: patatin-like phospholipase family protein [Flavobacteriales bacterium]|jgi:NTE family protein|nr:patatin-like phospholipase family protein [Flavobacteriales bacterium]
MDYNLGIVLSGGGVRALAHIGLLQALKENNIHPEIIAGTSGGALVGALYAAGYDTKTMLQFFNETPLFKFSLYSLNKPGIMDTDKYSVFFDKYFKEDSFEALKKPIYVTATNILNGQLEFFHKGQLIKPLLASAALPPIFSPIEIGDNLYSDGGIINNFPIEPLRFSCNKVIGSFVNPLTKIDKLEVKSTMALIQRVYHIGLDAKDLIKFHQCNYVFSPPDISNIGIFDSKAVTKSYEFGYQHAIEEMPKILESLN